MSGQHIFFGPYDFDPDRGTLRREGVQLPLNQRGAALLQRLLEGNGKVVSKAALMDSAWAGHVVEESNLSVQISALRKLLGPAPDGGEWLATVSRVGYRFVGVVAHGSQVSSLSSVGGPHQSQKPSIAVLPFANLSGDVEQEYLADGITEEIIIALTRFRWFFVLGRSSSFRYKAMPIAPELAASELGVRYVLQGNVRRSAGQLRISAQLIEARTTTCLWAERYDIGFADSFSVQDQIAKRVAGAIEPELLQSEGAIAVSRRTGILTASDLVWQGTWRFHQITRPTHLQARDLFREALMAAPRLPEAHIWLARVSAGILAYDWSADPVADRNEGMEAALTGISLDERNPYSHYALAIASAYGDELAQAGRAAERAVELNPNFALGHLVLGMTLLFGGKMVPAIDALERGLDLSPHDPQNFVWFNLLALGRFFYGDIEGALGTAILGLKVRPDWRPNVEVALCSCAELGRWEESAEFHARLQQIRPQPGDALAPLWKYNTRWAERIAKTLRAATAGTAVRPD